MAVYKVIQDVEAEDKILGPLTLRQFIYAGIAVALLYLSYFVASKGLAIAIIIFLPPAVLFGFFAFPWGRDQPTEVWALAKIRFLFKPRRRIWDQSGTKELVSVTAPKRIEEITSNQLSQTEVKSRLRALADTIDSRGWVVKTGTQFGVQAFGQQPATTERLLEVNQTAAQPTVVSDVQAADDMLDEKANARAQRVDSMISATAQAHRQKLLEQLKRPEPKPAQQPQRPAADYWFLNQQSQPGAPQGGAAYGSTVVAPGAAPVDNTQTAASSGLDENEIIHELDEHKEAGPTSSYYGHLKTIQPLSEQRKQQAPQFTPPPIPPQLPISPTPQSPPTPPVTPTNQAAILQLARNDDLNVATIAREAGKDGEVVINLH